MCVRAAQLQEAELPYVSAVYGMSDLVIKRINNPILLSDVIFALTQSGFKWRRELKVLIGS